MRGIDLNMGGPVWTYRPRKHKNKHRGLDRIIHLGPQAQEIVKPFLAPTSRNIVLPESLRRGTARQARRPAEDETHPQREEP